MPEGSSKGGGMSPATIFFFILAFFGIGAPLMMSSKPASSISLPNAKDTKVSSDEISARDLLEDFFDADADQFIDRDKPWQQSAPNYPGPDGAWNPDDPRRNDRISFLIATLPNPENPSLRYEFDRYIDSIQLALSHENYMLAKATLPWVDQLSTEGTTPAQRSRRPGVMLFRRADTADANHPARVSLMVVFVVGETPTAGVNAPALRSALDQIAWLRGWRGEGETSAPAHLVDLTRNDPKEPARNANRIEILGPSYSGSAASIEEVLRSWLYFGGLQQPTPPVSISLLSGSATAIKDWPSELGEFHSTELPDGQTYNGLIRFFQDNLSDPRLAILTDDTAYGNSIDGNSLIAQYKRRKARNHSGVTFLPYPIHISNVRTTFDSSHVQQANPAATPLGLSHRDLPITDEDPGLDRYFVPSFSRASAADDEMVLANLLSTINRENFHYVGIIATNIQDAIFLIREIRSNCPDTTPFLASSDLLYLHSDFNRDLVGTLIFSTYPLFASNQLWTWPSNLDYRRFQFPSSEAEGVYNAVLVAVDDAKFMVEYTLPFSSASTAPPMWLTVVGNNALWPVTVFQGQPGAHVVKRHPPPRVAGFLPQNFAVSIYPPQFDIAFAIVILLCTLPHLYMIKWHAMTDDRVGRLYRALGRIIPKPPRWFVRLLDDPTDPKTVNRTDREFSLLSFVLVLLTFFLVSSAIWLLPLRAMSLWAPDISSHWLVTLGNNCGLLFWAVVPTLIAGFLIALGLVGLLLDKDRQTALVHGEASRRATSMILLRKASWTAALRFIASLIGIGVAIIFAISIWRQEPLQALFYFVRAANLWDGVSPLLPMLYIGIAALWLSVSELWRMNLAEEYVLNSDFLGFGHGGSFTGIGLSERTIVHLLKCPTDEIPFWALWLVLPLVVYVLLDMPGFKLIALDGQVFTLFFIGIATFVYTSFLLMFGRFIAVWWELRSLLRRLAVHPTRGVYEELRTGSVAPSMADRQHIPLVAPADNMIAVEFCLGRAREMLWQVEPSNAAEEAPAPAFPSGTFANRLSARRVEVAELVEAIQLRLNALLADQAAGVWRAVINGKIVLQGEMSRLSRVITEIFEPWWRLDRDARLSARPAQGNKPDLDESLIKNSELFIASRVVGFLQQVFPQQMNLMFFTSVGLLALMLAVSSYPFPQHDTVAWLSWIILLSVIGVIVLIFVQINRDRVVSMLSGTTPGELNWNSGFVWQMVVFGILPILTLLGAQFPHALQGIFSSFGGLANSAH